MAVAGIHYEEPNPETYKNIYIHYDEGKEKIFESGNFIKDWYAHNKWIGCSKS